MLVKALQKLFVTHYFLPLTILGVVLLAAHHRKAALAVILTPPLYYLSSHAPIHFRISIHFAGLLLLVHPRGTGDLLDWSNVHATRDPVSQTRKRSLSAAKQ